MKNLIFVVALSLTFGICLAQKTEISVQASSGLFSYGGKSASSDPNFFINDTPPFYLVNPYSKKSHVSYGFALQAQRVTNKNGLFGLRIGYDRLATISHFDQYGSMVGISQVENGKVVFQNDVIHVNPYFGYRLPLKAFHLDATVGADLGSIRKSAYTVHFDGQSDFFESKTKNYFINTKLDFGPTLGLAAEYKRVGVNATYYYGLVNYLRDERYAENSQVYSRYLRLGVAYRIK